MMLAHPCRSNRRLGAALGALLALMIVAAALVAGCGGSSNAAASSTTGRTVQVLATVRRGDLVDSVIGSVKLASTKGKAVGVVQVMGQNAAQVAVGQPVVLAFFQRPSGAGPGGLGQGSSARPSVAPSAGGGGQGFYGQGGQVGQAGQGFFGQGGQGGQGAFRGKTAQGTVTSVGTGGNGSVTANVTITKLPAGVTARYMGIAQIQVKVLASNVLIIPTAAIRGSGGNATVQLLAGGKTSTQSVVVGRQTQTESEITSGLRAGQNVVYTRTFRGFPGRNGARPSGAPFGGVTSGT